MKTGPTISRGTSEQVVGTPQAFVEACQEKFGPITIDLAASAENAKRSRFITKEQDSLKVEWFFEGIGWLNPEFKNIGQWARKCWESQVFGQKILMLVPASVGSNWYRDFVYRKAQTVFLNGRIQFVGSDDPYPKDLMLCAYGFENDFEIWTPPENALK